MFNYQGQTVMDVYKTLVGVTWVDIRETFYLWAQYLGLVDLLGPYYVWLCSWYSRHQSSFEWLFPKGPGLSKFYTYLRNVSLHYGTGVSVGVLASVLILLYILSRFLPQKLKTVCYILMAMGTSASLWALQSITEIVSDTTLNKLHLYWHYVLAYLIIMGLLSFAVVYRYGPVTDPRTLNLIQWLLQFIGLILIYNGTQIREVSVALIIITLTVYNFPRMLITRLLDNKSSRNLWYRFFRPKIKLLTEEEYIQQGNVHTREELEKLREYCRSPDCKAWRVIGKLSSPHRFADFVEGNSWHLTNDELLEYDTGPDPAPPHLVSDDDNDNDVDDEIDFMLSSP